MRYFLGFCLFFFVSPALFAASQTEQFIQRMAPVADQTNQHIAADRQRLLNLYAQYQQGKSLGTPNWEWLQGLAQYYGIKNPDFQKNTTWQALINRVNVIPTSLVIAQAAMESAWGRSRFAKEANNYFGQRCYTKGCGLVPKKRAADAKFYVQSFPDMQASVASYIHNLNTHPAYTNLRTIRASVVQAHQPISGKNLAHGLGHYSTLEGYPQYIQQIIVNYQLTQYDKIS